MTISLLIFLYLLLLSPHFRALVSCVVFLIVYLALVGVGLAFVWAVMRGVLIYLGAI